MKLMKHQKEAVENLSNGKILYGGVGAGKSATVMAYYEKKEWPKDVYVITTAKKRDSLEWEREAAHIGLGTSTDGTLGGILVVDSWNSISKYTEVEDAFFIFDEQRLVGSGVWVKSFLKIAKNNNWILLTATPGDTWMDYVPVFIANNLYKNRTQFVREHVVYAPFNKFPKIVRYNGEQTLEKYRNMLLVEMPYLKHTRRIEETVWVDYDTEKMKLALVKRWNPYSNEPIKDVGELFRVMRRIVNTDRSRFDAILEIMKTHPRVVIFYNFDYELAILRSLAYVKNDVIFAGELNGHKKTPIPTTEKWVYLVQYVAGAEAWNCTATDAMIFYSLTYSYKNHEQAHGRIDRLDSPFTDLYYYILRSKSVVDLAVWNSLSKKEMFNERDWAAKNL